MKNLIYSILKWRSKIYPAVIMVLLLNLLIPSEPKADTWTNYTVNFTQAIAIEGDYVWCGTNGGVVKLNRTDGTYVRYTTADGLADNDVLAIAIDIDDSKWFGTYDGGVSKFDGQNWTTYTTANGLAENRVFAIAIDIQGNKWFGTYYGVSKFDGQTWTTYTKADGLVYNTVRAIAIDIDDSKWFGTGGGYLIGGVSKFDGQSWTTYTMADGLADNNVRAIAIDGDGNKWFGSWDGGVSKFDGQTWTIYTKADGLVYNDVRAIAIDGDGNKWFGTDIGGVSKFDGQTWTTYNTYDGLANNNVYAIAIEAKNDGTKWFGTYGGGVSRFYDGEGYIKYPPANFMGAAQNPNFIKWTWDEPSGTYGILGYEIRRKEDGGTYQTIADANALPVGTTYYDDQGLSPNTLYFANISSVYQYKKMTTEDIQRRTLCEVPPAPYVTIGYDGNYYTEININSGNNPSITEYAIFVASGNGTGIGWLDGTGGTIAQDNTYKTETGWEDGISNRHTGLNKGDAYKYAVRAKNYDGIKAPVSTNGLIYCQTITTRPTPPEAKIDGATLQPVYNDNKTVTFSSQGAGQIVFYYTYTNDGTSPRNPTNIDNDGTGNLPISANDNEVRTYNIKAIAYDETGTPSPVAGPWTVMIDKELPTNPTTVTESGGALNNTWGTVNDCNFTWSGASDGAGSGIDGYYYYWGIVSNGTSTSYTTSEEFDPAPIQEDSATYYLRVKTKDKVGNESAWTTLYIVKYDRKEPSFSDYSIVPSSDSIMITATAEDEGGSGVSEYYFERKEGGTNSGWIANNFWSDTGLIPNTLYNYTIKCKDLVDNISNELSVSTYTLCEIPGLEITYVTTDSVDMRITGNSSPETNYAIKGFLIVSGFIEKEGYASPALGRLVLNSDAFWETKENWYKLGASIDTLTISSLIADGQYEFQVKAKNISGETPFSVTVATTTLALGPPDLEISAVDKSSITIKVSKKGIYAEKFVLAISSISPNGPWAYIQEDYTTGADEYSFLFGGANVKEVVCKDLIGFTEYWFRAKAKDTSDNESFLSDWVSATTLCGAPVVKLENYEYGEWTNTLTFSVVSLQGAKNYYYKIDKSSSVQVTTSDPVLLGSFTAPSEGTWYLNVLGTDGINPSGKSSYILLVDITAPVANITAQFQNEDLEETQTHSSHEPKFVFQTQENLSGIDGYSYTFSTNANEQPPNPDNDKDTDSNEFVMQFTPANQEGTYYVKVKAKDNAGNWSGVAVFSLKYIPDWTAPKASVNVPGRVEKYGETIGVDTGGTINVSFDEQIWEGCLKDNTKIITIRDNEGKSIEEENECKIDYDQDKHIAKISPKDGWKKSHKYKFVVNGGIEDKAGNTSGEKIESIFTTMLGYKIRNVVMLECDEKTKMILEPNALREDGYVSINLEPLPLEKTGGAIEAARVNPEAIIEADEKIKNNDDKYSYNLRESMREINGYTTEGVGMVLDKFSNTAYLELPYTDKDNDGRGDGIVDSTQETPVPVKVITLSIYWLDEEHKLWVRVSGTKVDTENKVARARVIGFGVYTIMGGGFYDLSEAYAFPVPYKPNDGNYLTGTPGEGITFTNLTNEAEIEIYTITGELVKRLIHKDGNQEEWDPVENEKGEKVVSGVYVYYVKNARQHKSGKIMIIR